MALTPKLELRQSQALVMTPQLMQAIKLLQLSNLDLVAYVDGELERNPLLERTSEGEEGNGSGEPRDGDGDSDGTAGPEPGGEPGRENGHDASAQDWIGDELETTRGAMEERL